MEFDRGSLFHTLRVTLLLALLCAALVSPQRLKIEPEMACKGLLCSMREMADCIKPRPATTNPEGVPRRVW
jgi:hypothetical protein